MTNDNLKVFSRFGEIQYLYVEENLVLVEFQNLRSAYFALTTLNNMLLDGVQLGLSWCNAEEFYDKTQRDLDPSDYHPRAQQSKYTCRYDIPIENCKDFQIAKKIIGNKVFKNEQI